MAHKAEHAVDLETGAIVAVTLQGADQGDTTTMADTVTAATEQLEDAQAEVEEPQPLQPRSMVVTTKWSSASRFESTRRSPRVTAAVGSSVKGGDRPDTLTSVPAFTTSRDDVRDDVSVDQQAHRIDGAWVQLTGRMS